MRCSHFWLRGLQLDLYSIDSTWDDLDSTSLDSIKRIVQVNSLPGYLAGAILEYLGEGSLDWQTPEFDTTFVSDADTGGHGRFANYQGNNQPGIANTTAEKLHFTLYPNPASGNFIAESEGGRLSLMSLDGKVLANYELADGKTKISPPAGMATGVYMIRYEGEVGTKVIRLIYQP